MKTNRPTQECSRPCPFTSAKLTLSADIILPSNPGRATAVTVAAAHHLCPLVRQQQIKQTSNEMQTRPRMTSYRITLVTVLIVLDRFGQHSQLFIVSLRHQLCSLHRFTVDWMLTRPGLGCVCGQVADVFTLKGIVTGSLTQWILQY